MRRAARLSILLAGVIAGPCMGAAGASPWPAMRGCADPAELVAPIAWDVARDHVLPAILARAPTSDAACEPFLDGLVQCHLVLMQVEACPRQVTSGDLAGWHIELPALSRLAVANLDRLARPVELDQVLLGNGHPEEASHESYPPTAAAWVLTPAFREKLQALEPGAWFVFLTTPNDVQAWPAGQAPAQHAMQLDGVDALVRYFGKTGRLLSPRVFLLPPEGRLRPASPQELRSGRPDPDPSPSTRP